MEKTKLNQNNPHHQILIAIMAKFVEDFGYTPHELFELMNDSQKQLFHALAEIRRDSRS